MIARRQSFEYSEGVGSEVVKQASNSANQANIVSWTTWLLTLFIMHTTTVIAKRCRLWTSDLYSKPKNTFSYSNIHNIGGGVPVLERGPPPFLRGRLELSPFPTPNVFINFSTFQMWPNFFLLNPKYHQIGGALTFFMSCASPFLSGRVKWILPPTTL